MTVRCLLDMIKVINIPHTINPEPLAWHTTLVLGYNVFIDNAYNNLNVWAFSKLNPITNGEYFSQTDAEYNLSKCGLFETVLLKSSKHNNCTIFTNYD